MEHIIGESEGVSNIGRSLMIVSEANGRQIIGFIDGTAETLRVGAVMVYCPLLIVEQQTQGGRINTLMAPVFHGMLVEQLMLHATSMLAVTEHGRYREMYNNIYPKVAINIKAAEAGLVAPDGNMPSNSGGTQTKYGTS